MNTATKVDHNTRNHQPGDRVSMKRDPDLGGRVLKILPHPAYGQSYLIKWDHILHPGEGWCDSDFAV